GCGGARPAESVAALSSLSRLNVLVKLAGAPLALPALVHGPHRMLRLAHELQIARVATRIETPLVDRSTDGAAVIAVMAAVAETAVKRERGHVVECAIDPVVRRADPQLAHAGRVDQPCASRHQHEVA